MTRLYVRSRDYPYQGSEIFFATDIREEAFVKLKEYDDDENFQDLDNYDFVYEYENRELVSRWRWMPQTEEWFDELFKSPSKPGVIIVEENSCEKTETPSSPAARFDPTLAIGVLTPKTSMLMDEMNAEHLVAPVWGLKKLTFDPTTVQLGSGQWDLDAKE